MCALLFACIMLPTFLDLPQTHRRKQTYDGKRNKWKTPNMRRTNYPPAVSLPPTLTKVTDSRLQKLKHSAHFPGSAQELKAELDAYEKKLQASNLYNVDRTLMHYMSQQDATAVESTATSAHSSQRKH